MKRKGVCDWWDESNSEVDNEAQLSTYGFLPDHMQSVSQFALHCATEFSNVSKNVWVNEYAVGRIVYVEDLHGGQGTLLRVEIYANNNFYRVDVCVSRKGMYVVDSISCEVSTDSNIAKYLRTLHKELAKQAR